MLYDIKIRKILKSSNPALNPSSDFPCYDKFVSWNRLPCVTITAVAIRYYCCVKKLVGKQQKSGIGRKRTRDQQLQSYDISKIYLSLPNWLLDWSHTTIRKIGTRERGRKLAEQQDIDKEEGGEPGGVESQQLWYRPKKACFWLWNCCSVHWRKHLKKWTFEVL